MMKDHLIQIKKLCKTFPSPKGEHPLYALKNIDLAIPRGSVYGIIGMSGAGKSTLLRCLTGLDIPTSGSFSFNRGRISLRESKIFAVIAQTNGNGVSTFSIVFFKNSWSKCCLSIRNFKHPLCAKRTTSRRTSSVGWIGFKKRLFPLTTERWRKAACGHS